MVHFQPKWQFDAVTDSRQTVHRCCSLLQAMDFFFQNRYYKLNRLLLYTIGLWPYEHWLRRIPKVAYVVTLVAGGMCSLIIQLILKECTIVFFSGSIQLLVPALCVIANMLYLSYNSSKLRMCVEHIRDDWWLHDESDVKIMKCFAEISRISTLLTTMLGGVFCVIQVVKIAYPSTTVNASEAGSAVLVAPQMFPLIESSQYQLYAIFIFSTCVVVSSMSMLSIACMFCCGSIHAYGMFYIVGLRFETIFDNFNRDVYNKRNAFLELFQVIFFHNRAIKFVELINSLYGTLYIMEVGVLIGVMSCDVIVMFQSYKNDFNLFISTGANFIAILVSIFVLSFLGQLLMDESTGILRKAYSSRWYMVPPNVQRSIMTIMMRSQMECGILMTRSLSASYDMFLGVVRMAISYYMTMRSLDDFI